MNPLVVVAVAFSVMLAAWCVARSLDGDRISGYLAKRGATLLAREWMPFGRGWLGSAHERIYAIRYRDRDGSVHSATAKTSMLAGVYLTDDAIVSPATKAEARPLDAGELLRENERLRAENVKLQAELDRARRPQA